MSAQRQSASSLTDRDLGAPVAVNQPQMILMSRGDLKSLLLEFRDAFRSTGDWIALFGCGASLWTSYAALPNGSLRQWVCALALMATLYFIYTLGHWLYRGRPNINTLLDELLKGSGKGLLSETPDGFEIHHLDRPSSRHP